MADQPIDQPTEPTTRSLSLSAFMQEQPKGSIPYKVKQFQRLAMKYAEPDPTKALVEIEIVVPEGQSLASLLEGIEDFEIADLTGEEGECEELDADDVARIDAACAEYDALPVEVRSVLVELKGAFGTDDFERMIIDTLRRNRRPMTAAEVEATMNKNAGGMVGGSSRYNDVRGTLDYLVGNSQVTKQGDLYSAKAVSSPSHTKPGASPHSAKWDRCVEHVNAKGGGYNAYAVCTAALGEGSFRSVGSVALSAMAKALQSARQPLDTPLNTKQAKSLAHPDLVSRSSMSLKALPDGWVEGCAVLFTDPSRKDLTGDYFTKSTELAWEGKESRIAMYHHGMDPTFKDEELHQGWRLDRIDDVGVWVKHQLDMRDEYEAAIYGMVKAAKLGLSSGAASHLVKRADDGQLLRWPISEISYTPTPAEPGTSVTAIKALGQVQTFEELSGKSSKFVDPVLKKSLYKFLRSNGPQSVYKLVDFLNEEESGSNTIGPNDVTAALEEMKAQGQVVAEGANWRVKAVPSKAKLAAKTNEVVPVTSRLDRALALTTLKPQDAARVKAALKLLGRTSIGKKYLEQEDIEILTYLDEVQSATQRDIASETGITDNLGYLLQALESMGYVTAVGSNGFRITARGSQQVSMNH